MVFVNYNMLDNESLRNISKEECEKIGGYLSSTILGISTDWRIAEDDYKGYCMFMFDKIENLSFSAFQSKINEIYADSSVINKNYTFDSYVNSLGAVGSNITTFGASDSEIGSCSIDDSRVDYLSLNYVDITEKLKFEDTKSSLVVGQVGKL